MVMLILVVVYLFDTVSSALRRRLIERALNAAGTSAASGGATFALRNARLVLEDTLVHGSLSVVDGRIAAIDGGPSTVGEDLEGDYVMPGLVELHTDHLETHYAPRPGVRWPVAAARAGARRADRERRHHDGARLPAPRQRQRRTSSGAARCACWPMRCARPSDAAPCAPSTACTCAARSRRPTCWRRSRTSRATITCTWCR